jgi:hypothetical protein
VKASRAVRVRAHAKINLDLRVLGPRPDGFHELRTVFQAIGLHDTIECVAREGPFAIECNVAGVPLDRANLVWRAAETLWRSARRTGPLRDVLVKLTKRVDGSLDGLEDAWRRTPGTPRQERRRRSGLRTRRPASTDRSARIGQILGQFFLDRFGRQR